MKFRNMKTLVIFSLLMCVQADSSDKQDVKTKTASPPSNTIQQNQKYEMLFQPIKYQHAVQQLQQVQPVPVHHYQQIHQIQRPQYVPVQLIQKPYYLPHTQQHVQPQAMIIIAQPALLPQSLVYGNPTQQLLHYFQNNPQAKYQLLHGNYQQQQPQAVQMQHVVPAPTIGSYILTPAPQLQQITAPLATPVSVQAPVAAALTAHPPQHYSQQQSVQYSQQQPAQYHQQQAAQHNQQQQAQHNQQQPGQLGSIAQLAQLAAQQYLTSQMKAAPAIVTGFEHFTPEQQAQIKAQLSTHLGTNFHAVSAAPHQQYSAKYVAEQDNNDFVPSPQVKNEPVTTDSSTDILKTRYVKNKN